MSREDIVAVAMRLFAVYLVIAAVRAFNPFLLIDSEDISTSNLAVYFAFGCLPMLIAAGLLWFFPLSIANQLLPVARMPRSPVSESAKEVQMLGVSLLGLWLLAGALADVAYWATFYFVIQKKLEYDTQLSTDQIANICATAVELAAGLLLTLGASGVVGAIRRFRSAGV